MPRPPTKKRRKRKARVEQVPAKRPDGRGLRRVVTRERIRQAALELFSAIGFDETTTNAIAKRAGVAAGTIFVHASDKADLLFLVMHDQLESVVEARMASVPTRPLLEQLLYVFAGLFEMYSVHPGVAAAFVKHLPGASGPNAQRVSTLTFAFLHRLSLLVANAQARGEVARDVDPLACARNVFGLYFLALLSWISGYSTLEAALDPGLKDSLALQIRGFRPLA